MNILFLILAALAALVHIYIFYLETFAWTKPAAQRVFGTTQKFATTTKELAVNQGVYNGALAVVVLVGVVLFIIGKNDIGTSLILAGTGVMALAATYLFATSPDKRSAAVKQIIFPLTTIVVGVLISLL